MTLSKMTSRIVVGAAALSLLAVAACGDDDAPSGDDDGQASAAQQVCELMASQLQQCGPATPCDEALVASGLREIHIAVLDPDPAFGGGAAHLRENGICVTAQHAAAGRCQHGAPSASLV